MNLINKFLTGLLCRRVKNQIQPIYVSYQWILVISLVLFVSCQALAQEVKVQQMPLAATVSTNDFKENSTPFKIDGVSPQKERDTSFQEKITPLKIGDTIPDELWEMYFPVVSTASEKEQYFSLGDFKDKLIILDFWATWCAPCISSLHKLDSLQKEFDDLMVIPTSYEPETKVKAFFKNQGIDLPSLFAEKELRSYFPYKMIPHQVWIKNNVVRATVKQKDATPENIERILKDDNFNIQTKSDILDYNAFTSILTFATRTGAPILSTSSFTSHIEGLPASTKRISADGKTVVSYTNANPLLMYAAALHARNNRILVRGNNLDKVESFSSKVKNKYCYQLIVPATVKDRIVRNRVLSDLNAQFDLLVDSQMMDVECYVITQSLEKIKENPITAKSEDRSEIITYEFSDLVDLLNFSVRWTPDQHIFIDESNYSGKIKAEKYKVLQKDIGKLKLALLPYGLAVTKERRQLKMYTIHDAQ